jgi:diguanylate cyclase (GGDEF)-like protein
MGSMVNSEIEQYRYNIHLYFNALGCIAAFGFSVIQSLRGDHITGLISFVGGIYFVTIVYFLIKKKNYLLQGRGFVLFIPITILNILNIHPEYGIFWVYVGAISFFLLLEFKDACIFSVIFNACVFYLVSIHYPLPVQLRIYASLILVTLFTFILSFFINRLLASLNILVTRDALTNAFNRHTFHVSIEEALYTFLRYKTPTSLFIFDLDNFKAVNDNYGHQAGDSVLVKVSETIQERLRDSDKLFRYGGEEFAVLLTQTSQEDAFALAEELRVLVAQKNYNIDRPVTISGGVSDVRDFDNVSAWIERCDKALYEAKSSGRNKVIIAKA